MWYIFLIIVLIVLLVLGLILGYAIYHIRYWKIKQIPHESPKHVVELFRAIAKHVGTSSSDLEDEHYRQLYQRFKGTGVPFCGFYHLLQPRVLVLDLELVKQILIKDFSNFNSRGIYYNECDDPLSADLWSRSGNSWKTMRLRMEPIFQQEQMRHLYDGVYAETEKLLNAIELNVGNHEQNGLFDIRNPIRRYVISLLATCVFGLSSPAMQSKYPLDEFEAATELMLYTRRHDVALNALLTRHKKLARRLHFSTTNRKVSNYFMTMINDIVDERERSEKLSQDSNHDYLQLLIDIKRQELATHESDEDLDPKRLKNHLSNDLAAHIIGFLKAGFEPTEKTISYALYELALNEWAQDRARQEVLDVLAEYNNEFCYDAVQKMDFLGQIISETVRLHPIVPFLMRCTLTDYHVPGQTKYLIRKDMYIIIPIHAMHTDPQIFEEPKYFKPERFSKSANSKNREQCIWLGFGDGPRTCLGIQFAQLQMRIAIACLLRKYKFSLNATRILRKHDRGIYLMIDPLTNESDGDSERRVLI